MPRYLNPSALVAVKYLAAERLRWQRPRRASRVRTYAPEPSPTIALLQTVLAGLHRLEASA